MSPLPRIKPVLIVMATLTLSLAGSVRAATPLPPASPSLASTGPLGLVFITAPTQAAAGTQTLYQVDVINSGSAALHGVDLYFVPNSCLSLSPSSVGDVNGHGRLDPGEIWRYSCLVYFSTSQVGPIELIAQARAFDPSGQLAQAWIDTQTTVVAVTPPPTDQGSYLLLLIFYMGLGILVVSAWLLRRSFRRNTKP